MKISVFLLDGPDLAQRLGRLWALIAPCAPASVQWWVGTEAPEQVQALLFPGPEPVVFTAAIDPQRHNPNWPLWLEGMMRAQGIDLLLADRVGAATAAKIYSAQAGLPCVTGVHTLAADPLEVQTGVCSANLNWTAPLTRFPCVITPAAYISAPPQPLALSAPASIPCPIALAYEAGPVLTAVYETPPQIHPLRQAKLLLVGGRGLGSRAGVEQLSRLANRLGGQLALTRAAAMSGWGCMDLVVGQSGHITGADLCITFGVSGAAAFLPGVRDAKTLVAVNTDPSAPIFSHAQKGIVGDALPIIAAMLAGTDGA